MTTRWMGALACALALPLLGLLAADDKPQRNVYTDPAHAGPDYALQGEYEGTLDGEKTGAQIIADGAGRFTLRALKGGLPGAGWDGHTQIRLTGKSDGNRVDFVGKNGAKPTLADGTLTLTKGSQTETLKKVMRHSPTLGAKAPEGAVVLFDGSSTDQWDRGKLTPDHLLSVFHTGSIRSKKKFKDFTAHVEFRLPFMPKARGQGRANSGVYLQDRYEVQVLDSFGLKGENNECGGIYHQAAPLVNMCLPPLVWQTYDIEFTAARFEGGRKVKDAVTTIRHNGVVIQDHLDLLKESPGGQKETAEPGPFQLQDHGNPVVYRNVWVVERK